MNTKLFKYNIGDVVFVKDKSYNKHFIGDKQYGVGRIEKAMIIINGNMFTFWDWQDLIKRNKKLPKIDGEKVDYEIQQVVGYPMNIKSAWYNEDEFLGKINVEKINLTEEMKEKLDI